MMRLFAWLILLLPLGTQHLWGQTENIEAKIQALSNSEVLSTSDLQRAAVHQPFLIDRWHLMATSGWKLSAYPDGKGEPNYPVLSAELWDRYTPLDLELMGHIHRDRISFSRYRIGNTRQILTLLPSTKLIQVLNDTRVLTHPSSGQ
ncbi:MAG: hypothetical protein K9I85_05810 [Saprospiraceae bacterium]|nr:hypothetical protein [Saprospiraceae bacterium]